MAEITNAIPQKSNATIARTISFPPPEVGFTMAYNNTDAVIRNRGFAIVEPAVEIDFKLLKNRNLFITTQFGLSLPLSDFEYSTKADLPFDATTDTNEYLLDIILKFGVKYNFIRK